jgi:serine/threonine-protein kinase
MRGTDERRAELATAWAALGIDDATLQLDSKGTLAAQPRSIDVAFDAALPVLIGETIDQYRLGRTLGGGGMGVVRVAVQVPLGREVAIKSVAPEARDPMAHAHLLREAVATGALEHPNIVPVHALGRHDDGRPVIVMKRIEGKPWSELLESRPPLRSDADLDHHLKILVQVTQAVAFAHARGLMHRDIKPSNVMIGSFGEVYLLDWGMALRLRDDGPASVPHTSMVDSIAGTPHYMAPEMAAADAEAIDERTDVFLLGATLHELLTGDPPHAGDTVRDVLENAFLCRPPHFDERVPARLAELCAYAMSIDPRKRLPSALAFAQGIESFLQGRHVDTLCAEGDSRLRTLEYAVGRARAEDRLADRQKLYDTFSECRFAYRQALRLDPDAARGRDGLERCLRLMIDFELRLGSAGAAAAHLAELPRPDAELERRLEERLGEERSMGAQLERLRRDADVTVGDRWRSWVSLGTGAAWGPAHFVCGELARRESLGLVEFAGVNALLLVNGIVIAIVGRRHFFDTTANARTSVFYLVTMLAYTSAFLLGAALSVPFHVVFAFVAWMGLLHWVTATIVADRRLFPLPLALALGLGAVVAMPDLSFEWMGIVTGAGPIGVGLIWRRYRPVPRDRR